jgi:hypothetical protein
VTTFARPGRTVHGEQRSDAGEIGLLTPEAQTRIIDAGVALIRAGIPTSSEPDPEQAKD